MNEMPTQKEIESQVKEHIDRLKNRVDVTQNKVSIDPADIDPKFASEDKIALAQVNNILKGNTFKKKLCAGLDNALPSGLEIPKFLVDVLLPSSAVTSTSTKWLLGYTWTFAALPIGVIGVSLLAIYLARFGIGYYCSDQNA